jgi:hypothetical protein
MSDTGEFIAIDAPTAEANWRVRVALGRITDLELVMAEVTARTHRTHHDDGEFKNCTHLTCRKVTETLGITDGTS